MGLPDSIDNSTFRDSLYSDVIIASEYKQCEKLGQINNEINPKMKCLEKPINYSAINNLIQTMDVYDMGTKLDFWNGNIQKRYRAERFAPDNKRKKSLNWFVIFIIFIVAVVAIVVIISVANKQPHDNQLFL